MKEANFTPARVMHSLLKRARQGDGGNNHNGLVCHVTLLDSVGA